MVAIVPGGCSDSISKPVTVNANPISNFTFNPSGRLVYYTATQPGNTTYHWNFGDGATDNQSITKYHYLNSFDAAKFNVCLTVTNAAGCIAKTCKDVAFSGGINPLSKLGGVNIYPNPNYGHFTISVEDPKSDIAIVVYSLLGETIKTVDASPLKTNYTLDLNVANGIYLVKVTNGGLSSTQKITVNK